MANVKHLYRGNGNPNDNQALELTGAAIGNHIYQDLDDSQSIWLSCVYDDDGIAVHRGWERLLLEPDMPFAQVDLNEPLFEGQNGFSVGDNKIYTAMWNQSESKLAWRATGGVLGDWYTPPK